MIQREPGVPLANTSISTRKGPTPISRARSCAKGRPPIELRAWLTRARLRFLIVACVSLSSTLARAESAGETSTRTVVIVFEPRTQAVSQRLRQEIEAMGFEVELRPESEQALSLE